MKKRKSKFKIEKIFLIFLFSLATFILIFYFHLYHPGPVVSLESKAQIKTTLYPRQYSDKNITENAIKTSPKFQSLVFFDKESLLANTLSSQTVPSEQEPKEMEKGTWLWTPTLQITPAYTNQIISGAKQNDIKNIYISLDSYLDIYIMDDGPEKEALLQKFTAVLENFINTAHTNNITVDAEGGWRNWAEPGNFYKAYALMDYVLKYNENHSEKFRGFQFDIEPYLLDSYKNNKESVLKNFLILIHGSAKKLANTNLDFSVVIPDFYDGLSTETPAFYYGGEKGYTLDHLLRILKSKPESSLIIMSYRNFSQGYNGTIEISKNEIEEANNSTTRIIIAQETGEVSPDYITFHNTSKSYYLKQLSLIQKAFSNNKSFGGIATHYINSYMELH